MQRPQVLPSGPCPSKIMIVGEAPGENEVAKGEPFVGYSGQELSRMLHEAGINRASCFMTNVSRIRPPGNDIGMFMAMRKMDISPQHRRVRDKFVLPPIVDGLEMLKREVEMCRPNVVIAFGNLALWALTGKWGITSWRGSVMESDLELALDYKPKVVPSYHPAAVLRQWSWRQTVVHDLRRAKTQALTPEIKRPDYKFIIRPDFATVLQYFDLFDTILAKSRFKLAIDIETRAGHISCIGFAWSKLEALCIPFMCVENLDGYWTHEEEATIIWRLAKILQHPNLEGVGQNFLYDAQYILRHWHVIPQLARDTMLAQHACFSNVSKGLDFLSSMYCEHHEYWKDEGKNWDPSVPEEQHWTYNCKDAVITYEVDQVEQANVDVMGLRAVHDFQQSLYRPVLRTMDKGIRVDVSKRGEFAFMLLEEIAKREQWLMDAVGYDLNPKSPKQMMEFFYGELNFKPILGRKTRAPTCDDEALRTLASREPMVLPLVKTIAELRSLGVFLSTFVQAPLDRDGRLRCSFNIGGTETYRFSSSTNAFGSGLNLQNIPSGVESEGLTLPNVRKLFIPDPGKTFFDIDLASADLRIVVWESDEQVMKQMLREGLDPYTEIAKEFYHDPSITKTDPRRQTFKAFAHGTNYLGTAKGLAERLGLSVHEAEKTQRWYFSRFPRIKRWQDDLKDQVTKRRMVQNVFGYRQYFFDRIEGTIFNQAAAWIPQSTVACLINRAYVNIHNNLTEVDVLLQVHDSLAGQYSTADEARLLPAILKEATIVLPYPDPLIIPVGVKKSTQSWGDCK
jgi:DNA polymerase I-like protein with 3'-5' exonuclease and polymerase domains/uracil-DNA glycosylase